MDLYTTREKRIRSLENKVGNFWVTVSLYSVALGALATVLIMHLLK